LADEWKVIQDLRNLPDLNMYNETLLGLGFSSSAPTQPPVILKNFHQFYELRISFVRQFVGVFRGTLVFWVPSLLLGSLLYAAFERRRELSADQGLTVFLGVGLTTFALIVGALQLLPPALTWVETILYVEVAISIGFASWVVLTKILKSEEASRTEP
jgi:hypothetical protein